MSSVGFCRELVSRRGSCGKFTRSDENPMKISAKTITRALLMTVMMATAAVLSSLAPSTADEPSAAGEAPTVAAADSISPPVDSDARLVASDAIKRAAIALDKDDYDEVARQIAIAKSESPSSEAEVAELAFKIFLEFASGSKFSGRSFSEKQASFDRVEPSFEKLAKLTAKHPNSYEVSHIVSNAMRVYLAQLHSLESKLSGQELSQSKALRRRIRVPLRRAYRAELDHHYGGKSVTKDQLMQVGSATNLQGKQFVEMMLPYIYANPDDATLLKLFGITMWLNTDFRRNSRLQTEAMDLLMTMSDESIGHLKSVRADLRDERRKLQFNIERTAATGFSSPEMEQSLSAVRYAISLMDLVIID